jgi:hypothetical protein
MYARNAKTRPLCVGGYERGRRGFPWKDAESSVRRPIAGRSRKAHTVFEPVLPENPAGKPDYANAEASTPGSELNPHLRAVLERLKERDRERGK